MNSEPKIVLPSTSEKHMNDKTDNSDDDKINDMSTDNISNEADDIKLKPLKKDFLNGFLEQFKKISPEKKKNLLQNIAQMNAINPTNKSFSQISEPTYRTLYEKLKQKQLQQQSKRKAKPTKKQQKISKETEEMTQGNKQESKTEQSSVTSKDEKHNDKQNESSEIKQETTQESKTENKSISSTNSSNVQESNQDNITKKKKKLNASERKMKRKQTAH